MSDHTTITADQDSALEAKLTLFAFRHGRGAYPEELAAMRGEIVGASRVTLQDGRNEARAHEEDIEAEREAARILAAHSGRASAVHQEDQQEADRILGVHRGTPSSASAGTPASPTPRPDAIDRREQAPAPVVTPPTSASVRAKPNRAVDRRPTLFLGTARAPNGTLWSYETADPTQTLEDVVLAGSYELRPTHPRPPTRPKPQANGGR